MFAANLRLFFLTAKKNREKMQKKYVFLSFIRSTDNQNVTFSHEIKSILLSLR